MPGWSRRHKALQDILEDADFWAATRANILDAVIPLFTDIYAAGMLIGTHTPQLKDALEELVWEAEDGEPIISIQADPLSTRARDFIRNYSNRWWDAIESGLRTELRNAITDALDNGLGVADVTKRLEPLFGAPRARRIATSELTNLLGAGQQATYAEAGFTGWTWQTVQDAFVDPICDALQGQQFAMDVLFEKAHVNCRCFPAPAGDVLDMVQPLGFPTPTGTFTGA